MELASAESAFPRLSHEEMDLVRSLGTVRHCREGEVVFKAGDADIDFYVVDSGRVEILNPTADDARITIHEPGEFLGDIDLLTRRPVIVTAVARGPQTVLLRIAGTELRRLLNAVPRLGEKLIVAFAVRRVLLQRSGVLGLKVIGEMHSGETTQLREFLHKNFVPHTFYDSETSEGRAELAELRLDAGQTPVVACGDGTVLVRPTMAEVARCAGLRRDCPDRVFDLAIVGSGPAGMAAAVYAASEALSTVVLDRVGPGGQAAGSSMIENFIGFPSGLSGAELATRGVLQMLKFGAMLLTPVRAERLIAGPPGEPHTVVFDDGSEVRARCVLVATGARWRGLAARGAAKFERAGIYYAATSVEARVCSDAPVCVVGGGNSAGQAAMFLSECSPSVHMLCRGDDLSKGMSDYLYSRIRQNDRIHVHTNAEIDAVVGGEKLEAVEVVDNRTGRRRRIDCGGVFVFIGAEPYTQWLPPEVARDDHGYVLTGPEAARSPLWKLDREPCQLETTMPGVLAAGDVRAGSTKRVGFAVGDGSMAVTCVHRLRAL
jgi:thioredoxin reductase (NADPH)